MNKGILIVNKPKDYTSRDVVNIISKELKIKKVGHTGTLDPLATGVLVILIGKYTKLGEMLTALDKEYIAEIKVGLKTDTLDITGKILEKRNEALDILKIEKVIKSFKGLYHMEVPIYSAIKVKGKKLYQYAREGIEVKLPIKDVYIYDINLIDYKDNIIKFQTKVEKGTYIRSLIRDICTKLNTIGTMNSLVRIKQGNFKLEDANTIQDIKNNNFKLLSVQDVLDIKIYNLNDEEYFKIKNGCKIKLNFQDKYLLLMYQNEEVAIYQKEGVYYKVYVMF